MIPLPAKLMWNYLTFFAAKSSFATSLRSEVDNITRKKNIGDWKWNSWHYWQTVFMSETNFGSPRFYHHNE